MQRDTQNLTIAKVKGTLIYILKHNTQMETPKYKTIYIRNHAYYIYCYLELYSLPYAVYIFALNFQTLFFCLKAVLSFKVLKIKVILNAARIK